MISAANQQKSSKFIFNRFYLLAHGALGDIILFGCFCDASQLDNIYKILKFTKIHTVSFPVAWRYT